MSNINDGGPAFPVHDPFAVHQPSNVDEAKRLAGGMTLRDYFAAKAMQGFAASSNDVGWRSMDQIAETAYEWADAMLRARKEGGAS